MISIHRTASVLAAWKLRALREQLHLLAEIARNEELLARRPPERPDDIELPPPPPLARIMPPMILPGSRQG